MKRATSSPSQGRKKHVAPQRRAAGRTIDPTPRVIARKNAKLLRLPTDEEGNRNRYNHLDVTERPAGRAGDRDRLRKGDRHG